MQNTNTIYFHSDGRDSLSPLFPPRQDTFILCPSSVSRLPYTPLQTNHNLIANLSFTVAFLMIFAFVRLRGKELFSNLLNILWKRKKAEIIQNEGIAANLICYVLSLGLSFSILAICVVYLISGHFLNLQSLYIFAGLLGYHFFLLAIIRLLGWTFNARNITDEVVINVWTYHILIGLLVSPFVIALFFVRSFAVMPLLKIVTSGLLLFMSIKIIRWFEILFSYKVSILYMFLYLCTLEIMPLLVLYKVVA